jgi:hypothetical protein
MLPEYCVKKIARKIHGPVKEGERWRIKKKRRK